VARCAGAWNEQAPPATRRWISRQRSDGVRIGVAAARTAGEGLGHGALCRLRFFLGDGRTVAAQGPWTADGVPRWQGGLQALPAPMLAALLRTSNGALRPRDGAVDCVSGCDRRAPVPLPATPPTGAPAAIRRVPDACTLLSDAEVRAALGREPAHRTQGVGSPASSTCLWHEAPVVAGPSDAELALSSSQVSRSSFESLFVGAAAARRVRGLGELAYFVPKGSRPFGAHHVLAVWRRGVALTVFVADTRAPLETTRRLAAAALART
jgi:hypothetical protein